MGPSSAPFSKIFNPIGILVALSIFVLNFPAKCHGDKILFYNLVATPSHNTIMHPLAIQLTQKGHEVTFLASIKLKKEHASIKYYYPPKVVEFMASVLATIRVEDDRKTGGENAYTQVIPIAAALCRILMETEQEWICQNKFDLLVINACFNECGLGLGHKFGVPHVIVQTAPFAPWHADLYGIPVESSVIPDFRLNYTQNMNFFQRIYNTLFTLDMFVNKMQRSFYPQIEGYLREGLNDPQMPSLMEMSRDVRLLLVNSYWPSEYGHSFPPFVVPVGGLHCNTSDDVMPNEIQQFIDKFEGFIYVSFGTMSKLTPEMEAGLLNFVPQKFPQIGFVIKWAGEMPKSPPVNVLPVSWAPQQVLLANSKIRGFLSHCGMLSVQEASFYGVPVIAVPGRADQDYNAECLVRLGGAVRLEIVDLTMGQLENAVRSILYDETYMKKMKGISQLYKDRPMSPMDTAMWHLEFVLRNEAKGNDLTNMRPLGIYQSWWVQRGLDVWGFIFVSLVITIILIIKLLTIFKNTLCHLISPRKLDKVKTK